MKVYQQEAKKRRIGALAVFLIIVAVIGFLIFKKPSVTGTVVLEEGKVYTESLNIQKNESGTYRLTLKNPGSIRSLKATGSVTSNGTARVYVEKNGTRYLLFDSAKQLFDVNINVLPEYKKILQGDKILIQNVLFNLRGFGSGNVNVKYSIKDSKGNLIASEEETVFVETQAKFIRELVMPAEIKPGIYMAFVEASSNGTAVGTGSDSFEVKPKYGYAKLSESKYIMALAVAAALALIFALCLYGYKAFKKKKEASELKEKAPLEKMEKLEKELKALEEAHKAGLISEESYKRDKKRIEEKLGVSKK